MKPPVRIISGIAKETITVTCTDLPQSFTLDQLRNTNGNLPIECLVSAEGNNVRFAFITNPTQGIEGSGAIGHSLYLRQAFIMSNTRNIQNFKFINHINAQNAIIQVTMFYEIGG